jgi:thiamine biosynthesis lipoprotein
MMYKKTAALLLFPFIFLFSCKQESPDFNKITGYTQGTTYSIIYSEQTLLSSDTIRDDIERILHGIDMSLSTYIDSSLISRLNRNENVITDTFFTEVFERSKEISAMTNGAFDITVMPLVRAWGFGPDDHRNFDKSKLDSLMNLVGFNKVDLKQGKLVKSDPRITLDVNGIAQGYTVDVVCRYFDNTGIKDYLVEIGGEVRVKGKKGADFWKIGIDKPVDNNMIPGADLQAIIELTDKALATSGNYRKFYIEDGIKYSHTIDPKTGYPARNNLLSASIIADDCTTADGLATACMVMGLDSSIDFIRNNKDIEGYLIYTDDKGNFISWISPALEKRIFEDTGPDGP